MDAICFCFSESGINYEIVAAVDINEKANEIYKHNFKESKLLQRNIEVLDYFNIFFM